MPSLVVNAVTGGKTEELVRGTQKAAEEVQPILQEKLIEKDPVTQLEKRKKIEDDAAGKLAADQQALRRQRVAKKPAMGGAGRSGTILTSPLGQVGGSDPGVGRKTILGG